MTILLNLLNLNKQKWTKILLGLLYCAWANHLSGQNIKTVKDKFDKKAAVGRQSNQSYIVPTFQTIEPAGTTMMFPGRPVDVALNPDQTILAVKNLSGIVFINTADQIIKQTLALPEGGNTFTGIQWSKNGKKIWTSDTRGHLRSAKLQSSGLFAWEDDILLPLSPGAGRQYPGGFAIDEARGLIYVALNGSNAVAVLNIKSAIVERTIRVGIAPYSVTLLGNKAYVTNWGGRVPRKGEKTSSSYGTDVLVDPKTGVASSGTVCVIDLTLGKTVKEIKVHLHPCAMALSKNTTRLYVANANSDLISVIDTQTDQVIKDINAKPMAELPFGSAPNSLAVSPDGKTLYSANGGNNLLAVIDLVTDRVKGLIPTGWYPGAVVINKNGTELFVANVKGVGTRQLGAGKTVYKSNDHLGSVSLIPVPSGSALEDYTAKAAINMRLPRITEALKLTKVKPKIVPVPTKPGETSVFKHVLYIIKENKTYDQVFGDLKQGNGDSTLCLLGRHFTPNIHALAESFVLLDNTYCNGVLSADGHQWTNEGYVTDYLEKSFGGFVRSYPYAGDDPLAYASSGFIWDQVLKKGLSFRDYGEFVDEGDYQPRSATWAMAYNDYLHDKHSVTIKAKTHVHTLQKYVCPTYPGFTGTIPDVYRAKEFIKEFDAYEKKGQLPNFMIMLLPDDHTVGLDEKFPTPQAAIADNDLALGRIIERVSKSKFWKQTAIFVIQDDPQSGYDHVDGKRTVALCISPYTKRGAVISDLYNQNSVLRTIELILGLAPMSQFDLIAEPMTACFNDKPNFSPYTAVPNQIPIDQMNYKVSTLKGKALYWAQKSKKMPLQQADQADDVQLNKLLWHAIKGYDVPYPATAARR